MRQILPALAALVSFAAPAVADGPVVVELYTSQGCSSCPPADELLHVLAEQPDVIALALHVDYWDYIGWKDSFADPTYTARQQNYGRVARASTIYTPQMIIDGQDHVIGTRPNEVAMQIAQNRAETTGASVSLARSGGRLRITGSSTNAFDDLAVVQVIRFSPEETVDIARGENAGRQLSYANIVTEINIVGAWDGRSELDMSIDIVGSSPVVVIVQEPGPGAVMASAILQ